MNYYSKLKEIINKSMKEGSTTPDIVEHKNRNKIFKYITAIKYNYILVEDLPDKYKKDNNIEDDIDLVDIIEDKLIKVIRKENDEEIMKFVTKYVYNEKYSKYKFEIITKAKNKIEKIEKVEIRYITRDDVYKIKNIVEEYNFISNEDVKYIIEQNIKLEAIIRNMMMFKDENKEIKKEMLIKDRKIRELEEELNKRQKENDNVENIIEENKQLKRENSKLKKKNNVISYEYDLFKITSPVYDDEPLSPDRQRKYSFSNEEGIEEPEPIKKGTSSKKLVSPINKIIRSPRITLKDK